MGASKEVVKKLISELMKFVETADEVQFSIDAGIFELPLSRSWWVERAYDGEMTITIKAYHEKRDGRKERIERMNGHL